jgi:hypothetical protein
LLAARRSPLAVFHHSPFAIRCAATGKGAAAPRPYEFAPFAIRCTFPLAARRSLLAVFLHSPFAIRYSPSFDSPFAALHHLSFAVIRSVVARRWWFRLPGWFSEAQ